MKAHERDNANEVAVQRTFLRRCMRTLRDGTVVHGMAKLARGAYSTSIFQNGPHIFPAI